MLNVSFFHCLFAHIIDEKLLELSHMVVRNFVCILRRELVDKQHSTAQAATLRALLTLTTQPFTLEPL